MELNYCRLTDLDYQFYQTPIGLSDCYWASLSDHRTVRNYWDYRTVCDYRTAVDSGLSDHFHECRAIGLFVLMSCCYLSLIYLLLSCSPRPVLNGTSNVTQLNLSHVSCSQLKQPYNAPPPSA